MPIIIRRSYREIVRTLWEFERWRCIGRLVASTIALLLAPVVFVSLTVLAAYVAGDDFTLRAALIAAVVAGGCAWLVPRLAGRQAHWQIIEKRLRLYQTPNTPTETPVLVRASDAQTARSALRRARFDPWGGGDVPMPPSDASPPELQDQRHEPAASWRGLSHRPSDRDRMDLIEQAFGAYGISVLWYEDLDK